MTRAPSHLCSALAVGLITLACPVGTAAQCDPAWVLRAGAGPSPGEGRTLTYDPVGARLILLGGSVGAPAMLDAWAFSMSPGAWSRLPAVGPASRYGHAAAYDSDRARVVLFGGGPGFGDTWELDLATDQWVNRLPAQGPSPRYHHVMAYDAVRRRVVLFGGLTSIGSSRETWEWDGAAGTWELRSTVGPPNSDYYGYGGAAFDAARGRTVRISPAPGSGPDGLWDTWEWDPATAAWQQRSTLRAPQAVHSHGIAYDPARSRIIAWASYYLSRGTWEFDGTGAGAWTFVGGDGPSDRRGPAIAVDSTRDRIFLYGGLLLPNGPESAELWERDPNLPTNITANSLPPSQIAAIGQPLELSVSVSGVAPLSFRWRRNWQALANGGHISGTDSATLRFAPFLGTDAGSYDVAVTDGCGYSLLTPLTWVRNNCMPDCDQNGILNAIDWGCYLDHFAAGCDFLPAPCYANCDGSTRPPTLNILDFMCFLNAFAAGCP